MDNIKKIVLKIFQDNSVDILSIPENQSLIETGKVDSMTFVNILLEIEEALDIEIDFEKVDINSIVSLEGLLTYISTL